MALEEFILAPPYSRNSKRRPIVIEGDVAYIYGANGKRAIIDAEDVWVVDGRNWDVQVGAHPYFKRMHRNQDTGARTLVYLHRLIMRAGRGSIIDHVNRNPLDNRKSNLRFVTAKQNVANSPGGGPRLTGRPTIVRALNSFHLRLGLGAHPTKEDAERWAAETEKAVRDLVDRINAERKSRA